MFLKRRCLTMFRCSSLCHVEVLELTSDSQPGVLGPLGVLGLSTGVTWGDSWYHRLRPTSKMYMRGYFRNTLGRAKFSWCALTQKRLGATALVYGNPRPRATAQLHTVYAGTLFMWEATHLHRETRRRSATSICYWGPLIRLTSMFRMPPSVVH